MLVIDTRALIERFLEIYTAHPSAVCWTIVGLISVVAIGVIWEFCHQKETK
ncbi:hypothetical protein [Pseudomonas putida]|uniref:Uncharacterized protein n=1 Tax=Pseudomonas putida TaxID=303 RepID=A0A8I1ED67_PSEPU|nr:hypothetical protein [Pseudomonas putida]MBI6883098.1 hypothetical protein [Pseudomonas putida]